MTGTSGPHRLFWRKKLLSRQVVGLLVPTEPQALVPIPGRTCTRPPRPLSMSVAEQTCFYWLLLCVRRDLCCCGPVKLALCLSEPGPPCLHACG